MTKEQHCGRPCMTEGDADFISLNYCYMGYNGGKAVMDQGTLVKLACEHRKEGFECLHRADRGVDYYIVEGLKKQCPP